MIREKVASTVKGLSYAQDNIANYALRSVEIEDHVAYRAARAQPILSLDSREIVDFYRTEFDISIPNAKTGFYSKKNRVLPRLVSLD